MLINLGLQSVKHWSPMEPRTMFANLAIRIPKKYLVIFLHILLSILPCKHILDLMEVHIILMRKVFLFILVVVLVMHYLIRQTLWKDMHSNRIVAILIFPIM